MEQRETINHTPKRVMNITTGMIREVPPDVEMVLSALFANELGLTMEELRGYILDEFNDDKITPQNIHDAFEWVDINLVIDDQNVSDHEKVLLVRDGQTRATTYILEDNGQLNWTEENPMQASLTPEEDVSTKILKPNHANNEPTNEELAQKIIDLISDNPGILRSVILGELHINKKRLTEGILPVVQAMLQQQVPPKQLKSKRIKEPDGSDDKGYSIRPIPEEPTNKQSKPQHWNWRSKDQVITNGLESHRLTDVQQSVLSTLSTADSPKPVKEISRQLPDISAQEISEALQVIKDLTHGIIGLKLKNSGAGAKKLYFLIST